MVEVLAMSASCKMPDEWPDEFPTMAELRARRTDLSRQQQLSLVLDGIAGFQAVLDDPGASLMDLYYAKQGRDYMLQAKRNLQKVTTND